MSLSGIALNDEVTAVFNELKLGKGLKYVIYRINENHTEVIVEKKQAAPATWAQFVEDLPKNDCRYAVFDYHYETESDGERNKLVFVLWTPETAKIKSRMLYPSTKDAMKRALVGISTELQATDASEIDEENVIEKFQH